MPKFYDQPNHGERKHSELGASICYRWWNCPGSVALTRGMENPPTDASRKGTAAHELAQKCLDSGDDATDYIGLTYAGEPVDQAMAEAVQMYLDDCRSLPEDVASERMVEVQFDLSKLHPPAPMYGTADFVAYDPLTATLYVRDYKNGFLPVDAVDNPQLKYYALGAMLKLNKPVMRVEVTICQPNGVGASIKRDTFNAQGHDGLRVWGYQLMEHARATQEPDAPLVAGDWCSKTFCPARGKCPAHTSQALAIAQAEFGGPPAVAVLTPEELGAVLSKLDLLRAWIKDVEAAAVGELNAGRDVPGWKLIEKESNRDSWTDEAEAETILSAVYEVDPYATPKLASPAQIRGRLAASIQAARGGTKKAAEAEARKLLKPLAYRPTRAALAPATDPRPALSGGAAADFGLPDETE
jgi:hypothetical protein